MRTAAEIDAAKVLNTTDLGAVTSEVRAFPPGYVTGGRLKLNTNLQIEVAPIAINIAGKDVRIPETTIIGNEHWTVNGTETPRVPGSWYYLYLSTAGQFAVSPNEPVYNNLYFAYYHGESQDLRAIGKFYFGDDGTVLYVQTSLEIAPSQVLVAASTYSGEDANYYCTLTESYIFIDAAQKFLSETVGGGTIRFTEGDFDLNGESIYVHSTITLRGTSLETRITNGILSLRWPPDAENVTIERIFFEDMTLPFAHADNISIQDIKTKDCIITYQDIRLSSIQRILFASSTAGYITTGSCTGLSILYNNFYENKGNTSLFSINSDERNIIIGNRFIENYSNPFYIQSESCLISGNILQNNCQQNNSNATMSGLFIVYGSQNIVANNFSKNNGNLIDRSICDNSSTSPMIFGEAAPTASNCTWGFTSTGPYEGTGQYRFTKTAAAGTIAYLHLVDNVGAADVHGLIPGTQYEWGGWLKVAASASCGFQGFRIYQATTAAGAASSVAFTTATTGWQEVWVTATIYVNATTAYIGLVASASLAIMSFDVDNLRLFPPGTTNVHNQNYYDGGTDTYDGL